MQPITTKFLPANVRGARIKATCDDGTVIIAYPHELTGIECHRKAAQALADKLGWTNDSALVGISLPSSNSAHYVFFFDGLPY